MNSAFILPESIRAITSAGLDWPTSWAALRSGSRRFSAAGAVLPSVPEGPCVAALPRAAWRSGEPPLSRRLESLVGLVTGSLADELRKIVTAMPSARIGIVFATSHGEPGTVTHLVEADVGRGETARDVWEGLLGDKCLGSIRQALGMELPGMALSAACASGVVGLGCASDQIKLGLLDACVLVAGDVLSRIAYVGFRQVGAMSKEGCRPFHKNRDGTTIGEAGAAAILVSEETAARLNSAEKGRRRAYPLVEILGYGTNCDARHAVEPTATGISDAIFASLEEAKLSSDAIRCAYWHGTGTIQNDAAEAQAAISVFATPPPGTATKGVFGHSMGASGLLSVAGAVQTLIDQVVPPTHSLDIPAFPDLNVISRGAIEVEHGPVLVVALGFGGINSAAILDISLEDAVST